MQSAALIKDIRRAEKAQKQAELARVEFLRGSMATVNGRIWFHQLLSSCHIFASTFTGEPNSSAFNEGMRNVGLGVYLDIVTHCPDQFVIMMQEASIKEQINGRRTADEHPGSEDGDGGDQGPGDTADSDGDQG